MIDKDQVKDSTLVENTAQAVRNHLMSFKSNRDHVITRWIWELLQNARDASPQDDSGIIASIEYTNGELLFQHNGRDFTVREISHLIFHGSTKAEDKETIGQYGSGFLTTHLLSPSIEVSGRTDEGETFKFQLTRELSSVDALKTSMDSAWDDFKASTESKLDSTGEAVATQFRYLVDKEAEDVVEKGLSALKVSAPFLIVFNRQFDRIYIQDHGAFTQFKVTKREVLQEGLQEITVEQNENGEQSYGTYIIADGDKASIAIPIKVTDDGWECLELSDIPRLFLGFPLIRTETFSFPAVINSFDFTPEENRDGVALWLNEDDLANQKNQAVIEEACRLHLKLIQFISSKGSSRIYTLANVPSIHDRDWLNEDRLRECLSEQFVKPMRQLPITFCEYGFVAPIESHIPRPATVENHENLWDLLNDVKHFQKKLPIRKETLGWGYTIDSWATILEREPTDFDEAIDGSKLAGHIENGADDLDGLKDLLNENTCEVEWLNQLHQFLIDDGVDDVNKERSLVLDQGGNLDNLDNLYRDDVIDDELKDIADNLGLQCRLYLRDRRLTALGDHVGRGNRANEDVLREINDKLQELANNVDDGLSAEFVKASIGALSWTVRAQDWKRLGGFPVFSQSGDTTSRAIIWLPQNSEENSDTPLAPIKAWPNDLQEYSDLFPRQYILADGFFEAIPCPDIWQTLSEKGFVNTNVIITKTDNHKRFLPSGLLSEDVDHKSREPVRLTNIAFLSRDQVGIMERVRRSPSRARILWRFITKWMSANDPYGLDALETDCVNVEIPTNISQQNGLRG